MNIAFMGSPEVSKNILEYLIKNNSEKSNLNIKLVVTREDKIRGRGKKLEPTPVKKLAEENEIKVLTPKVIDDEFIEEFKKYEIDLALVVAYGKILPKKILDLPKYGFINVHFSLLPKYRGASPVETAILNGDDVTGVTIINMNEKMDEGDIIFEKEFNILENDQTLDVFNKALDITNENILNVIENIKNGKINPKKQDEKDATYTKKLTKDMSKLDFNKSAKDIHNKVRAFSMSVGTNANISLNVKIWKTQIVKKCEEEFENIQKELAKKYQTDIIELVAGTLIVKGKEMFVKSNDDLIQILVIQPENKTKMETSTFLNGYLSKIKEENVKIL